MICVTDRGQSTAASMHFVPHIAAILPKPPPITPESVHVYAYVYARMDTFARMQMHRLRAIHMRYQVRVSAHRRGIADDGKPRYGSTEMPAFFPKTHSDVHGQQVGVVAIVNGA